MKAFAELFRALDETTRTKEKVAALTRYFRTAQPRDASWALFFLTGEKLSRAVSSSLLKEWVSERTTLPLWMVEECYDSVGDLAETLALLLPEESAGREESLAELVEGTLLPLQKASEVQKKETLYEIWDTAPLSERFLIHKLLTGGLRVGVSKALVTRALAQLAGVEEAEMAHRLTGTWEPSEEGYRSLLQKEYHSTGPGNPYPFFLASPLDESEASTLFSPLDEWCFEWKWDGIRAQLLHRNKECLVWSRGEEAVTESFPEVQEALSALPNGTVLDGELVAWKGDAPLPFGELQRRLNRKKVGKKLLTEVPVRFIAYDLLQVEGNDIREDPLASRRKRLTELLGENSGSSTVLTLSMPLAATSFEELRQQRASAREQGTEGLMVKRWSSPYRVGRKRGDWWKWKVDPLTLDAVLTYAQKGHGRRADLFSDYTFALWSTPSEHDDKRELVTIAKAYSGLTDNEMREVDHFVRKHTVERFGPVRRVEPHLVFELGFDDIRRSRRHKAGLALRFPRMLRWRRDKKTEEADSLLTAEELLHAVHGVPDEPS
ncbi:ATP-dependent DNA ligase [bacterium]|nr:ATP-dependent DNA ligase [bacterium]